MILGIQIFQFAKNIVEVIIQFIHNLSVRDFKKRRTPPSVTWQYNDDGTWWDDPTLTVTSLSEKPDVCEVTISLSEE